MTEIPTRLSVLQADITTIATDAIVNAANSSLLGGGGVDGAIHRAAGPELLAACRLLHGCRPGQAKLTDGFRLPARYVIHTVGPVWQGGRQQEAQVLASCYQQSLELAVQYHLQSIAFPCISTGVYRYPVEAATRIAIQTTQDFIEANPNQLKEIIFCCFSAEDADLYRHCLASGSTCTR